MTWNFNKKTTAAMDIITRIATKGTDPLQDDTKAIIDRAAQDASTVVSNLANERMLAEQYHKSDKSKGLDKNSEFYATIQKYAEDNFKRSKPQLDSILSKYQEKDELASMVGAYHKAFEDHFYEQVTKAWKDLRPSQTINPLPGEQPAAAPAVAPEMAPVAARRLL